MRTPVVDRRGVPLMPCHPAKARRLLAQGKAHARWNKVGLFYIKLMWEQEPDNQPLAVGIDPGSTYEGYAIVGSQDTVLNLMAEAPTHVKEAVKVRRTLRRARGGTGWWVGHVLACVGRKGGVSLAVGPHRVRHRRVAAGAR